MTDRPDPKVGEFWCVWLPDGMQVTYQIVAEIEVEGKKGWVAINVHSGMAFNFDSNWNCEIIGAHLYQRKSASKAPKNPKARLILKESDHD